MIRSSTTASCLEVCQGRSSKLSMAETAGDLQAPDHELHELQGCCTFLSSSLQRKN